MNKHEVISRVYDHLMMQGEKSIRNGGAAQVLRGTPQCLYRSRNEDGVYLACAIGALIDEDLYDEEWNNKDLDNPGVAAALRASGINVLNDSEIQYLEQLQRIHDYSDVCNWENKIIELADTWGL